MKYKVPNKEEYKALSIHSLLKDPNSKEIPLKDVQISADGKCLFILLSDGTVHCFGNETDGVNNGILSRKEGISPNIMDCNVHNGDLLYRFDVDDGLFIDKMAITLNNSYMLTKFNKDDNKCNKIMVSGLLNTSGINELFDRVESNDFTKIYEKNPNPYIELETNKTFLKRATVFVSEEYLTKVFYGDLEITDINTVDKQYLEKVYDYDTASDTVIDNTIQYYEAFIPSTISFLVRDRIINEYGTFVVKKELKDKSANEYFDSLNVDHTNKREFYHVLHSQLNPEFGLLWRNYGETDEEFNLLFGKPLFLDNKLLTDIEYIRARDNIYNINKRARNEYQSNLDGYTYAGRNDFTKTDIVKYSSLYDNLLSNNSAVYYKKEFKSNNGIIGYWIDILKLCKSLNINLQSAIDLLNSYTYFGYIDMYNDIMCDIIDFKMKFKSYIVEDVFATIPQVDYIAKDKYIEDFNTRKKILNSNTLIKINKGDGLYSSELRNPSVEVKCVTNNDADKIIKCSLQKTHNIANAITIDIPEANSTDEVKSDYLTRTKNFRDILFTSKKLYGLDMDNLLVTVNGRIMSYVKK